MLALGFTCFFSGNTGATHTKTKKLFFFFFGVTLVKGRILTLISVGRPRMKQRTALEGNIEHGEKVRHSCRLTGKESLV